MIRSGLFLLTATSVAFLPTPTVAAEATDETAQALSFEVKTLEGQPVPLSKYQGKVILMVNVASQCGLTPQYKQLQELHEKYGDQGLAILGFPCNQFGQQEPGSASEIRQFCQQNYGVEFDMFEKIDVNGDTACPLYKYLTGLETEPKGAGRISWNFEKFLLNRDGKVVARFEPQTKPDAPVLVAKIEKELSSE
jgi:glutathione peroxidase